MSKILLRRENGRIRHQRLKTAKEKGDHNYYDWVEMTQLFNYTCVRCLCDCYDLGLVKDHITPIYQGGSNGLDNIQPLCRTCNSSKGPESIDFRKSASEILGIQLPEKYFGGVNG